jgi:hypothetical protein
VLVLRLKGEVKVSRCVAPPKSCKPCTRIVPVRGLCVRTRTYIRDIVMSYVMRISVPSSSYFLFLPSFSWRERSYLDHSILVLEKTKATLDFIPLSLLLQYSQHAQDKAPSTKTSRHGRLVF